MSRKYTKKELERIEHMASEGYIIRHIAKDLGRSVTAIRDVIKRYEFEYKISRTPYSEDIVEKIRQGVKNNKTFADIARELDMPAATIGRWAKMNGISTTHTRCLITEERISSVKELLDKGYNKKQIAEEIGVSSSAISDWCIKFNLCDPLSAPKRTNNLENKEFELKLQRIQSLLDKDYTYRQIGKIIGVSASTIGTYVKNYELKSNRKYHHTTLDLREKVRNLTEDGYTPLEISDIMDIEPTEVYYIKRGFRD